MQGPSPGAQVGQVPQGAAGAPGAAQHRLLSRHRSLLHARERPGRPRGSDPSQPSRALSPSPVYPPGSPRHRGVVTASAHPAQEPGRAVLPQPPARAPLRLTAGTHPGVRGKCKQSRRGCEGGGWRLSTRSPSPSAGSLGEDGRGEDREEKKKKEGGRGKGRKKKGGKGRGGGQRCSHPHDGCAQPPQLQPLCFCSAAYRAPTYTLPCPAHSRAPRPRPARPHRPSPTLH